MTSAFDELAAAYDREFTDTVTGSLMRRAVWRRMDARFRPGQRILELNCGTGEDAIHLAQSGVSVLATDRSPEMVKAAAAKLSRRGLAGVVDVETLAWEELDRLPEAAFDGALSNFGGLNCVQDLGGAAAALARRLRPGAPVILCVMGPWCVWEWLWFGLRGKPHQAFRRLRSGAEWRGIRLQYPSAGVLQRRWKPWFAPLRVSALGLLAPPPFAEGWASRHQRAVNLLDRWERRIESLPLAPRFADHYVCELSKRPLPSATARSLGTAPRL